MPQTIVSVCSAATTSQEVELVSDIGVHAGEREDEDFVGLILEVHGPVILDVVALEGQMLEEQEFIVVIE